MFQPDPNQWPILALVDILPPQFRDGVAPSRYEVALSDYLESQRARCRAPVVEHAGRNVVMRPWFITFQAVRGLFGAVLHPGHGRSRDQVA